MGLHTCAQEAWAMWHSTIANHTNPAENLMLFCGVGVGYMNEKFPINSFNKIIRKADRFYTCSIG